MAYNYNYITNRNAKSFTKGRVGKKWDGTVVIHWWGDPKQNPTAEGVVKYFETTAPTSAHFVLSGTGRVVYHLVNNTDTAYHAGDWDANCRSIGIECDPRCRDEDYDVLAELLSDLWIETGVEPILYPHRHFSPTACPGNYDIDRIDREMKVKYSAKKNPKPAAPQKQPVPAAEKLEKPIIVKMILDEVNLWNLETNPNFQSVKKYKRGDEFRAYAKIKFGGSEYFVTEYSYKKGIKNGINSKDVEILPEVEKPVENSQKTDVEVRVETQKDTKNDMSQNTENAKNQDVAELSKIAGENNVILKKLLTLVEFLVEKVKGIFK